jgi:hypothetical protein
MKLITPLFFVVCTGLASACGGSQPAPESAPAPSATPEVAPAPPPESTASAAPAPEETAPAPAASAPATPSFDDMTEDQKKELMKTVVLPHMKATFQELDAKMFANFSCVTCHGDGAKSGKFTMPNPKLPKLDPKDDFAKAMKAHEKTTKFMMERVKPEMTNLLGLQPYDPKTNKGFGCMNCHTMAGK